ncbi:hypothetical protein ACOMHN_021946 [Nucella lapillus]
MQSQTTTVRTSRRTVEGDDDVSSYQPKTTQKSVIIQRGGGGYGNRNSRFSSGGSSMSTRISASFNPAVYTQMAGSGIADFRDHRVKEKREMQDCNERLATYIEKVRWLECENKKLDAENEALRKRKQEDWKPIRDMYEGELKQAREVIKDLSTQKGVSEARLAGLQDEIESLKDLLATHESQAKDYCKKIDQLNSQIGEYEGELNTLRLRCDSLEDEVSKLRALIAKYKEENARLRADLDAETAAHIEQEVLAQTKMEENQFLEELLEQLNLVQQEPITVKGQDMESFFKGELRKSIRDVQQLYNDKMDQITMECETKLSHQMDQLRSGSVRDNMEAEHSKQEVTRLRDQNSEKNKRIADLEAALASLRSDRDNQVRMLHEMKQEYETQIADLERRLAQSTAEVDALMVEIRTLIDAKMGLEVEIACYKKLLEGEENRSGLRQLVEQSLGVRSNGASQMADLINQSSASSMTMTTTKEKSRTGNLGIQDVDQLNGGYVKIEVDSMSRKDYELQNLKLIRRNAAGMETHVVDLSKCQLRKLEPGKTLTVCARSYRTVPANEYDFITNIQTFDAGPAEFILSDNNKEVATMRVKQVRR